jgi:hypothetical protein
VPVLDPQRMQLAPAQRRGGTLRALLVGLGTMVSVVLICCCVLSVCGLLWPRRKYLICATLVVSVAIGTYSAIQTWRNQRKPGPISRGRCPDCGTQVFVHENGCSVCGRHI